MNHSPYVFPPNQGFLDLASRVDTYGDLPDASTQPNNFYYVRNTTGIWLINQHKSGFYYSNGSTWTFVGDTGTDIASRLIDTITPLQGGGNLSTNLTLSIVKASASEDGYLSSEDWSRFNSKPDSANLVYDRIADINTYIGAAVYIDSMGILKNALASSESLSRVIGFITDKPTPTTAHVILSGLTPEIFTGLTIGASYFLDPLAEGAISTIMPINAGEIVLNVGTAMSPTQLFLNMQNRLLRAL